MDMRTSIEQLIVEAEQQIHDQVWAPTSADRALAAKAAADLQTAIGTPHAQEALCEVDRLERLRGGLAVLAISLARVHGRLAWFLGAAVTALTPVLHWRALSPEGGPAFGTVHAEARQYADAEDAIRLLQDTLSRISTA
ncbi:hypothetical protein [Streptomyces sp. NPDC001594]|uniref:hypothetical protein n=1 Tax=Streptomyces sp. NPDC001594 TaxID=3364590 RepID=UPI0036B5CC5A